MNTGADKVQFGKTPYAVLTGGALHRLKRLLRNHGLRCVSLRPDGGRADG